MIGQRDISDHSSLNLKINLIKCPKKMLWRLNTSLLNSNFFKAEMAEELKTYLELNITEQLGLQSYGMQLKHILEVKLLQNVLT